MRSKIAIIFSAACFFLSSNAAAEETTTADTSREAARQAAEGNDDNITQKIEIDKSGLEDSTEGDEAQETFELKGIEIDSDIEEIKQETVQHIIDPYLNKQVNVGKLRRLSLEIKNYCRQKGWLAAVAFLPEQDSDLNAGIVTIKIKTANFGKVIFNNQSKLADDILKKVGSNIKETHQVQNHKIENVLYLINEIGGVRARGALIPDTTTKRINLNINVVDDQTKRGIFYLENYGAKTSGRYRAGIIYDIYNIDNRGSRFEVSGLLSSKKSALGQIGNKNLDNYVFDYSWISDRKTTSRLGISFGRTTYHQHGLATSIIKEAGGHSLDWRFYGTTPVWKTIHDGFVWNYGYKFRAVTNSVDYDFSEYGILVDLFPEMFPTHNSSESYIHTFSLGFSGYKRSLFGDLFNYSLTLYNGYHSPRSQNAKDIAEIMNNDGRFFKSQLVLDYRKLFSKYIEFHTNITFQNASRNLNSAEQMQIGGANGVRGYADGDGAGDEGYLTRTEIIWHTPEPGLSLSTFLDIGGAGVKTNHDIQTIRSWGFEANYAKPNDYFIKLDYARKIGNNSLVASDDKRQRFWFMVGKIF